MIRIKREKSEEAIVGMAPEQPGIVNVRIVHSHTVTNVYLFTRKFYTTHQMTGMI